MSLDSATNIQRSIEMSNLKQLIEGINAAKKQFEADAGAALKVACSEFFAAHEEVTVIAWTQYAPYFNDGEPCEFSVHGIYASSIPVDEEDHGERTAGWDFGDDENPMDKKSVKEFLNLLNSVPDDLYRSMFGDDALVVITRDGIEVSQYDHE